LSFRLPVVDSSNCPAIPGINSARIVADDAGQIGGAGEHFRCRQESKHACYKPLTQKRRTNVSHAAFCRLNGPKLPTGGPKVDHERRQRDQQLVVGSASLDACCSALSYSIPR